MSKISLVLKIMTAFLVIGKDKKPKYSINKLSMTVISQKSLKIKLLVANSKIASHLILSKLCSSLQKKKTRIANKMYIK